MPTLAQTLRVTSATPATPNETFISTKRCRIFRILPNATAIYKKHNQI